MLGIDPEAPVAPELLTTCASILAVAAVDAERCRLIVAGDFVASVQERSTSDYYRENYDLRRSTGMVAAKTMTLADGSIDVLVPAGWFSLDLTSEQADEVRSLAVRAVWHEAQHVAIAQAGESDPEAFVGEPWARRNFLTVADQVIEEYRAERALAGDFVVGGHGWDLGEVLETWRNDLIRIACVEYQEHLDVGRLWFGIGQECQTIWKLLAYVAATLPADADPVASVGDDVSTHPLWSRMVGPHWLRFVEILRPVPPGSDRVERARIERFAGDLADELSTWLKTLGFDFSDGADGNSTFYITDWSLLTEGSEERDPA
ncbi:hypothetical protein GCM10027517_03870 [Phycicoccus ginsengisoli]